MSYFTKSHRSHLTKVAEGHGVQFSVPSYHVFSCRKKNNSALRFFSSSSTSFWFHKRLCQTQEINQLIWFPFYVMFTRIYNIIQEQMYVFFKNKKNLFIFIYYFLSFEIDMLWPGERTCSRINNSNIRVYVHFVKLFELPAFFAVMIHLQN